MINEENIQDLGKLFNLMHRGDHENSQFLSNSFAEYIEKTGMSKLKEKSDPLEFIDILISFKKSIDNICNTAFSSKMEFQQKRDEGFKALLNKFEKFPIYLATHTDYQLTRGNL